MIEELAAAVGGTIEEAGALPDGSGFAVMSMPLPKDHWLTADGFNVPPMPLRIGTALPIRPEWNDKVRAAARYTIRAATDNGRIDDFDPDAMVQCFIVGMLGYHTPTGLSADEWDNPKA